MKSADFDMPQLFEAFIKSAQYLVRLQTQQDVWDHLGKFLVTYLPADWTAFVGQDSTDEIAIHCCAPSEVVARQYILTDQVRAIVRDVLESGFLASQMILTPAPSMTVFLPIVEQNRTEKVMLIGHQGVDPVPNDLLNIYLAIAGLAGTTFERLNNERELSRHRARLEELVKERTAEIELLNESLRQRAAELEASNKELESFSYSVSHDLRSPLRAIHGFSQAVFEDYADRLDEQGKGYLQRVCEEALRMGQLIEDLLDLSRVTRWEMRRAEVDLSDLVQTIVSELRRVEPKRNVNFELASELMANGDPRLLRIVLENLMGNAWKFTANQPDQRIEFSALEQDGKTVYYIRDNGAGFDMAYANKLFVAFQRLHSVEQFPGTGIGLATVQRIINRHGGRVWAEGEVNKGATFYFTLE